MNAVGGEETMTQKRIGFFKEIVPNLERLGMIAPVAPLATSLTTSEKDALKKWPLSLDLNLHITVSARLTI